MKRENRQMLLIYTLVFIIIILLIFLTKIVMDANQKKPEPKLPTTLEEDVDPYPAVNDECTFSVSYHEYNQLTRAGCQNGYTMYNINDVKLAEKDVKVTIVYSDKNQNKVGLFINDKNIISSVEIEKIKFGVFNNMLFILDKNVINVLAFNKDGKNVYNLKDVLSKNQIKEQASENIIKTDSLDSNNFKFVEGSFEFDFISNTCQNGEVSKGSHYIVKYSDEKFELPEFVNSINCG